MTKRCRGVTWEQSAQLPRSCVRCFTTKEASGFPAHGRLRKTSHQGITRVCWTCIEIEAWAMYHSSYKPRLRIDWVTEDGQRMRLCTHCTVGKPLDSKHFAPLTGAAGGLARTCRKCRVQISLRARAKQLEREADKMRARHAAGARKRRKRPEVKRKEREARKRWREKVASTPEGRARLLELARMNRRLKREREGKSTRMAPGVTVETGPDRLPVGPLVAFIDAKCQTAQAIDHALGSIGSGRTTETDICQQLGVNPRTLYRWRHESQGVMVALVERVLLNAGVDWTEVYPFDDFAAHFLGVGDSGDVIQSVAQLDLERKA